MTSTESGHHLVVPFVFALLHGTFTWDGGGGGGGDDDGLIAPKQDEAFSDGAGLPDGGFSACNGGAFV